MQVEAAIKAITADGTTVLEEALMLPAPTDRDAAERELNQLVRQINNLGPVNQVAMEEYEQLKRRADYIEEQLADLESARKALTKITVAIDRKMRKAFLVTFEKVDANFREIFAMLFPIRSSWSFRISAVLWRTLTSSMASRCKPTASVASSRKNSIAKPERS